VEVNTEFTWVARLPTLDLHPLSRLVSEIQEAILDRMEWAPDVRAATHFSVASAVACPLPQCITTHHTRGGSPLTLQAHICHDPSSGGLITLAESASARILLGARLYLQRSALSPSLIFPLLLAACFSFNASPRPDRFGHLSNLETWTELRPNLTRMAAVPGTIVSFPAPIGVERFLGLYLHPLDGPRQRVFSFESRSVAVVTSVSDDVSPLTSSACRSSRELREFFSYGPASGVTSIFGTAARIGNAFGIAPTHWALPPGLLPSDSDAPSLAGDSDSDSDPDAPAPLALDRPQPSPPGTVAPTARALSPPGDPTPCAPCPPLRGAGGVPPLDFSGHCVPSWDAASAVDDARDPTLFAAAFAQAQRLLVGSDDAFSVTQVLSDLEAGDVAPSSVSVVGVVVPLPNSAASPPPPPGSRATAPPIPPDPPFLDAASGAVEVID
jgi:hypothetical protein